MDIRLAGEEYPRGALILNKATKLTSRHIAILAAAGLDPVRVYRQPGVSLLITGSELVSTGEKPGPGQIRDSNRLMLESAVKEAGANVVSCGHAGDSLEETVTAIEAAAHHSDLVICAGGVSVGPHDHVKKAALQAGFTEHFWRVRQKPGKPLYFAGRKKTLLFGLPGNPVSAYICFCHYILPAISCMSGLPWVYNSVCGITAEDIVIRGKRPELLRVSCTNRHNAPPSVMALARQGSHMVSSIAAADGYIFVEPGSSINAGTAVEVIIFP